MFSVTAVEGIGEVGPGADLSRIIRDHAELADGDIIVITSKIVSKAEGRVVLIDRESAIRAETRRVVARRGSTSIVENWLGLVMAAAGVDASNVGLGSVALLPVDPDASARRLREDLHSSPGHPVASGHPVAPGHNVAVVISDTAGRPWRQGQTDIAIGVAGLRPLMNFAGRVDRHGNELSVTAPAVADELAGAAELASGKLGHRPVVVVRGLSELVLPVAEHGPGAVVLIRDRREDMFALGTREAVVAALTGGDATLFGRPASRVELAAVLSSVGYQVWEGAGDLHVADVDPEVDHRLRGLAIAHGWQVARAETDPGRWETRLSPATGVQV